MMKLKRLGALATTLALTLSMTALPAAAIEFTDVPSTYWGYSDISKMSNQGYAKGYEDGTFKPEGKMTAADTLLFCARATGVESSTQCHHLYIKDFLNYREWVEIILSMI